ncbi:MAG: hypothetical protein IJB15_12325, partial [Clostridia bacterium]|nr:hypothetical protein [Clostridia bacterium]
MSPRIRYDASISAAVVSGPKDRRTARCASKGGNPMASSARDGSGDPLWQADPAETARPARSA